MKRPALLAALLMLVAGTAAAQNVVISQVYGGGGNSGAPFTNDYVEVFNRGATPADLAGWSLQYASATGTGNFAANPVVALGGTLAPGHYRLVALGGGANGVALPAPDFSGSTLLAAGAGKLALVSSGAGLACNGGSTPCAAPDLARIADLVGYGNANFFEGSAAAPTLSNTVAALRAGGGCGDTNDNAADFTAAAPSPRNAASAANVCGAPVNAPIVTSCPAITLVAGSAASGLVGASDADGIVTGLGFAGTAPAGIAIADFLPATGLGGSAGARLEVAASLPAGSYPVELRWSNNQGQAANCTVVVNASALTRIGTIQGRGAVSPLVGASVTTEGVVTRVTNNGYFLQDPVGDGDPLTSDGLFVFNGSAAKPAVGQRLRLTGTVTEFNTGAASNATTAANPLTQLTTPAGVTVLAEAQTIAPVNLTLPVADLAVFERHEGMLVTIAGPLAVSQNFFLGRYGQLTVAGGTRLEIPTNRHRPGPQAQQLAAENARRSLLLDDGSSLQNPSPIPYIGADNTVRAGDTITALTGVLDYGLATNSNTGIASYRLQPTAAPGILRANARTQAPDAVGGNLRVASFNVLNFFTTFTDGSTADGQVGQGCRLGDEVAAANCRGASNLAEFLRQRAKIVEAMAAIDADVLGLIEIQNNGPVAVQNLVDALNARVGTAAYAVLPDPSTGTGSDAIKTAMIYKPARLQPVGGALSDTDPVHNRPPLGQTFAAANGERFTLVVNHFKSKGCDGASGADLDQGDLQGCFNATRVAQAQALRRFVEALKIVADSEDLLVIGDLNAYAQEDPIADLAANGFVDEIGRRGGLGYSYVFDGAAGRLDHALATTALSPRVTGVTEWHINADEPSVIDYNTEFKPQDLYSPTPWRSSDHDPVVIGLQLVKAIDGSKRRDRITGSAGDDVINGGRASDLISGNGGRDVFVYGLPLRGTDLITDFLPGDDRLDLRALFGGAIPPGSDPVASGTLRLLPTGFGVIVQIDANGPQRPKRWRSVVLLLGVKASALLPGRDILLH